MNLKIMTVTKVEASDVKKGDLLINARLPNGFGHVDCIGREVFPSNAVAFAVGGGAYQYAPTETVEVAATIVDKFGYGTRVVEGDSVVFHTPAPLYEGPCEAIHPLRS
jgi:hypothetical protein